AALAAADLRDPAGEPGDEALVVDAGRVGEAREVPDATAREEAAQAEEVRPGTAEAMDEDDGGWMWRRWVEAVAHQQAERQRGGERAERRQLARDRPPPRHQRTSSWLSTGSIANSRRHVRHNGQDSRPE